MTTNKINEAIDKVCEARWKDRELTIFCGEHYPCPRHTSPEARRGFFTRIATLAAVEEREACAKEVEKKGILAITAPPTPPHVRQC